MLTVGLVGLVGLVGSVGSVGSVGLVGLVGLISVTITVSLASVAAFLALANWRLVSDNSFFNSTTRFFAWFASLQASSPRTVASSASSAEEVAARSASLSLPSKVATLRSTPEALVSFCSSICLSSKEQLSAAWKRSRKAKCFWDATARAHRSTTRDLRNAKDSKLTTCFSDRSCSHTSLSLDRSEDRSSTLRSALRRAMVSLLKRRSRSSTSLVCALVSCSRSRCELFCNAVSFSVEDLLDISETAALDFTSLNCCSCSSSNSALARSASAFALPRARFWSNNVLLCSSVSFILARIVSSTVFVSWARFNIFRSASWLAASRLSRLSSRMASISESSRVRSACTAVTTALSFLNFSPSSSMSMSSEQVSKLQAEKCLPIAKTCALVCSASHTSVSRVDAQILTSSLVYE